MKAILFGYLKFISEISTNGPLFIGVRDSLSYRVPFTNTVMSLRVVLNFKLLLKSHLDRIFAIPRLEVIVYFEACDALVPYFVMF